MKTFLYILTTLRDGSKDGVPVVSGTHYSHHQLLAVIEAEGVNHATRALNTKVVRSFDRSKEGCSTVYYTSDYYGVELKEPFNHKEGHFFFSLKELEPSDVSTYPDLDEKIRLKVTAPPHML